MNNNKILSIIILTWNSMILLQRCLASIKGNTNLNNYEIIIIDNNSSDGTREFLMSQENNTSYHFIFNDQNKGVGPARNQGIKIAAGEYIMLLDVDTIVTPCAIDILVNYLDRNPETGLVAPKLTNGEGDLQFTCRMFPTLLSKFLRRMPIAWAQSLLSKEEFHDWDHDSIKEVDYVIGACQVIRKTAIDKVGMFDENIFYGPEDIDICLRMWQAGYKIVYNPWGVIIHDEQRITKKIYFSKISWEHAKAMVYFFYKHKYLFSRKSLYMSIRDQHERRYAH